MKDNPWIGRDVLGRKTVLYDEALELVEKIKQLKTENEHYKKQISQFKKDYPFFDDSGLEE